MRGLTCMFQVRGRGGTFCPAAAAAAAAALACFVCCMICVIRSNCCRVRPSFPFPAGELGDGDLELLLWDSPPVPFRVTEMLPVELVVEIVLLQLPMLVELLAPVAVVLVVIGLLTDEPYDDAEVNWMLQVAPCGELASPEMIRDTVVKRFSMLLKLLKALKHQSTKTSFHTFQIESGSKEGKNPFHFILTNCQRQSHFSSS